MKYNITQKLGLVTPCSMTLHLLDRNVNGWSVYWLFLKGMMYDYVIVAWCWLYPGYYYLSASNDVSQYPSNQKFCWFSRNWFAQNYQNVILLIICADSYVYWSLSSNIHSWKLNSGKTSWLWNFEAVYGCQRGCFWITRHSKGCAICMFMM